MNATPTEKFLKSLYQTAGNKARRNGKGWSARCPAHEDQRPSLSVSECDDGRTLVWCHAGCTVNAIRDAVGLAASDLFSDDPNTVSTPTQPHQTREKRQNRRHGNGKPVATYQTDNGAIEVLERKLGKRSTQWSYHDAHSNPVGVIVRWNKIDGKEIRAVARCGNRWIIGGMPTLRPLYGLPNLAGADRIYVTEGEKAADAAREIGLTATTSSHGSQSPEKTNWSPLSGKECVILPDNDDSGRKYADSVTAILANLIPPAVVKVVHLPDLPDRGDMVDWVEARRDADVGELLRQVETLSDKAEVVQADRPAPLIKRFQPFPTDALPEPIRGFIKAGAKAIGCDPSYLALPLLTALAATIGNTRRVQLKRGWTVPAIIWTAIIGESGTAKTPAFQLVMQPLRNLQQKKIKEHAYQLKQYEAELTRYDKALSAWKRDKKSIGDPPEKPEEPQAVRFIVIDTTVEALAPLLLANPRGVLLARDELAGWIGSFDRYAGGMTGGDSAHWLSMYNGEPIVVDRKTGNPRTIHVPQASVSVTGGIQPGILHRTLGVEHRESGLAARLLLAWPPRKPKRWTEADIDPEKELERLFGRLSALQPNVDDTGYLNPVVMGLTSHAKVAWKNYYNHHAEEQTDLSGELSAAWSKLEEYAARLALVIQLIRWAAGNADSNEVDTESMKAGIKLAQWFKAEARRVYPLLSESDDDRKRRQLIEWIERKGGSVTTRQVQQGCWQFRESQQKVEAALNELARTGYGNWHDIPSGPKGGRPRRVFHLSMPSTSTQPLKTRDSEGSVDVDDIEDPETQPDHDWQRSRVSRRSTPSTSTQHLKTRDLEGSVVSSQVPALHLVDFYKEGV